jgi:hypothetical protein
MGQRASTASSNEKRYMEEILMGILWLNLPGILSPGY